MKIFKRLSIFLFCFALTIIFAPIQANAEVSINESGYLNKLYSIPGTDNYIGYTELKGFVNDKFRVYYKGNYQSYSVQVEDVRGFNPEESVVWYYNGTHTNTRKDCYSFFVNTSYYRSTKGESDEALSEKWFGNTFGKVYSDWVEYISFTDEANSMVNKYLEKQSGITYNDRFSLANLN